MTDNTQALKAVSDMPVYYLAHLAECAEPSTSDGISFLKSIATDFVYSMESEYGYDEDTHSQIVNDAPDIYTHRMWVEFVDLCAYREDVSEYGVTDSDAMARLSLCAIAERLVTALETFVEEYEDEEGQD